MTRKNIGILFYYLILLLFFCACDSWKHARVYGSIPKGSKLNGELLRAAEQIYPHERGLILLYNDPKIFINSGYYLLFFDSSSS